MTYALKRPFLLLILGLLFGVLCVVIFFLSRPSLPSLAPDSSVIVESVPDFSSYQEAFEKKKAFFDFLYPIVSAENQRLLDIRDFLLSLQTQQSLGLSITTEELLWLKELATIYRLADYQTAEQEISPAVIDNLIKRVDIIPPSLIMSQAALESGWGTSRFAQEGNNLFGQWCFEAGCGLVPEQRQADKTHEVATFETVNHSVRAYMINLNSFSAYQTFRKLRERQRSKQTRPDVNELLIGLIHYSEEGLEYIEKIATFIARNKLETYDRM